MMDNDEIKKSKYESPTIIPLGELTRGSGQCTAGSGDVGACEAGNIAGTDCAAGITAGSACTAGTTASAGCGAGSSPTGSG